jgi:hypothetical protein
MSKAAQARPPRLSDSRWRAGVFVEAYIKVRRRRKTRGERSSSEKEPFRNWKLATTDQ